MWCIPATADGEFVYHMEDVLEVYQRPYDPLQPTVCMDELSKQLVGEVAQPLPLEAGRRRFVEVTEHRTKIDWAYAMRDLVDIHYPDAELITLVMDNLNTHSLGSLYQAFAPAEAKRIADRLNIHHTPKHGSWLNMAEIELGVLSGQCLDRRIPDHATLNRSVALWQNNRNQAHITVDWRFTTADARIKLKRLYPSIHES